MSRYIDADEAREKVSGLLDMGYETYERDVALSAIDETPTADVTPVVHGHWYFTEYEYFTCSVCGKSYYNGCDTSAEARSRLENGDVFDFCPHCGAKMDEEIKA